MIRAIILCCDEQKKKMNRTRSTSLGFPMGKASLSLSKSYGDGLNCGYESESYFYSCGQSPCYTNYRMGWSNGYSDCQRNPRYRGLYASHHIFSDEFFLKKESYQLPFQANGAVGDLLEPVQMQ